VGRGDLSNALFTDLYQLTMAQAYWRSGHTSEATFSLFFRDYPPNRSYLVFVGLADVLDYLEDLRFTGRDIALLRDQGRFDGRFLDHLAGLKFTGSVRAMAEGSVLFANEPAIEATAPIIEAQIVETYLLNQVTFQTMLASKAARVVSAARGRTVVDFAARRTHGTDAANKLARGGYMAGFTGTSNVMASALYDIPAFGTMAHSWITTFDDETDAFRAYAESFPDTSTFLVDTYDTVEGTRNAARVGREMKRRGHQLRAVRLDSGDLLDLSRKARAILDEAGLPEVEIFASGGLDEFEIDALLSAGAPIDGFGVGTKVGVSADAPSGDSVYKLVQYDGRPVLKLSPGKQTLPGPKQVYRRRGPDGLFAGDAIARQDEKPEQAAEPLLEQVMSEGRRLNREPDLGELRERFAQEFARLPSEYKKLISPPRYPVEISSGLRDLQSRLTKKLQHR
jgi:nicotinate phosphoribosyltransferase